MPIFDQPSLEFRQDLPTDFSDLLEEPLSVLNTILEAMQQYWNSLNAHLDEIRETLDQNARILTFRFIIQNNEKSSFHNLAKVYNKLPISQEKKDAYNNVRDVLINYLVESVCLILDHENNFCLLI